MPACVTTRQHPIETLQPAQLTLENPRGSIAISASQRLLAESVGANESAISLPVDSLIANALFSLQHLLQDAPGYENTRFFVHIALGDEPAATSDFDMTVWLNSLQIRNTYYGQQYSFFEWEAYLYVHYAANWLLVDRSGAVTDNHTDRDLMIWPSGIRADKSAAVTNLPAVKDAWWDLGIAAAQKYVARIAPQWQTGARHIYMVNKFPELSMLAHAAMQNNAYARAFDIWENMMLSCRKRGQKRTKSQIASNMAVACELQNNLDDAIHWAQRSQNLNHTSRTANYIILLRERKLQQEKLDRQIEN